MHLYLPSERVYALELGETGNRCFISRDVIFDEIVMRNLIKYDVNDANKIEMFLVEVELGMTETKLPEQVSDSEEKEANDKQDLEEEEVDF